MQAENDQLRTKLENYIGLEQQLDAAKARIETLQANSGTDNHLIQQLRTMESRAQEAEARGVQLDQRIASLTRQLDGMKAEMESLVDRVIAADTSAANKERIIASRDLTLQQVKIELGQQAEHWKQRALTAESSAAERDQRVVTLDRAVRELQAALAARTDTLATVRNLLGQALAQVEPRPQ